MARGGRDDEREFETEPPAVAGRGPTASGSDPVAGSAEPREAGVSSLQGLGTSVSLQERDVPLHWRDRTVHLSASARDALRVVGTFRTVAVSDLARTVYAGDRNQLDRDLRSLARRGWLERHTAPGRHGARAEPVVVLSREGHAFASRHLAPDGQTLHWGFVKPKEQAHDAALYRVYEAEAGRIARAGGTVRRVVLDAELKGQVAARRNQPGSADGAARTADVARALDLRVVGGTVQIPDVRLEYETREGTQARVDLELATEHYKPSQVAAKAQAGFTIYAPASQTGRLSAALDERGVLAEIFSL